MTNARIHQSKLFLPDARKKAAETLLEEAHELLQKAKNQYEHQELEQKLSVYREKYNMTGKRFFEPCDPKKTLNQALIYFKASMSLGNPKAKASYQEAKDYYNEIYADEEGFILVRVPSDLEADIAFDGKNAISKIQEKKNKKEHKTEIVKTKLDTKINFISNWYRDPLACQEKSPVKIPSPIIRIS